MTTGHRLVAVSLFCVTCMAVVLSGCGDKTPSIRVMTPYGDIDTSGTTTLDLRGILAPKQTPAPDPYANMYPLPSLTVKQLDK